MSLFIVHGRLRYSSGVALPYKILGVFIASRTNYRGLFAWSIVGYHISSWLNTRLDAFGLL